MTINIYIYEYLYLFYSFTISLGTVGRCYLEPMLILPVAKYVSSCTPIAIALLQTMYPIHRCSNSK